MAFRSISKSPYSTYNELASGEFWYVSIKLPEDMQFYQLTANTKDSEPLTILSFTTLTTLKETKHSIEITQDKSNHLLT